VTTWATILLNGLALFTLVMLAIEHFRARIARPAAPAPLGGLTLGDAVIVFLYFAAIFLCGFDAIRFVLT
jgi:hypothetical protein